MVPLAHQRVFLVELAKKEGLDRKKEGKVGTELC